MLRFLLVLTFLFEYLSSYGQDFRIIDLPVTDICYSQANDRLYAVVGGARADGNAIFVLNPLTGDIEQRIEIGSEPSVIRVSENGRYLYVMLYGAPYLQRYDLTNGVIDPAISTESISFQNGLNIYYPYSLQDLVPLPGSGTSVAVSFLGSGTPGFSGLAIFDQLLARPNQIPSGVTGGDRIVVSDDGQTLWGLGHGYEPNALTSYQISGGGLVSQANYPNVITGSVKHISQQNGRIYIQNGQILDISSNGNPTILATLDIGQNTYPSSSAPMVPALDSNDIYLVTDYDPNYTWGADYPGYQLKVYDKTNFSLRKSHIIPDFRYLDLPSKIISLGKGRVAIIASHQNSNKLVLFNDAPCQPLDLNLAIHPSPVNLCVGDTVELNAAPGYGTYFWSNGSNGQAIQLVATTQMLDSLSYRVLAPNGCLSKPSPNVLVRIEPAPGPFQLYLYSGINTICPNETASFISGNNTPNASFFTCSNGDTAQINQYFNVRQGGVYYVTAVGATGCKSAPVPIEILEALPGNNIVPEINANGPLTFCSNTPTVLSTPLGAYGYEWSNGKTTNSITPPWSGAYSVRILYENGCKSPWSDTLAIVSKYVPSGLTIAESYSDLLVTNPSQIADSLQWLFNGSVLANVNGTSFSPIQEGFYTIQNFQDGCGSILSQPYLYPQPVRVKITPISSTPEYFTLSAEASPNHTYDYQWSNGVNNPFIGVDQANTYCVTATRISDGITATACITLLANDWFKVNILGKDGISLIPNIPVVIYNESSSSSMPIDSVISDINGGALFENVPEGNYKIRAIPDINDPISAQLLPTYWISSASWDDAASFISGGMRLENTPPTNAFINMIPLVMLTGDGTINGVLIDGLFGFSSNGSLGNPLVGVSVFLYDAFGNIVAYAITDINGVYSFINLPPGIYTILVNLHGVPPIKREVELTQGGTLNNMNFTLVNGVFVVRTNDLIALNAHIWPNPTTDKVMVELPQDARLNLYSTTGQQILQLYHQENQRTTLSIAHLPDGAYFLQINANDGKTAKICLLKQGN